MYVTVRRYKDVNNVDELKPLLEQGLGPVLKQNSGFIGYYIATDDDGNLVSMKMFDNKEAAETTLEKAGVWAAEQKAGVLPSSIDSVAGEVRIQVER